VRELACVNDKKRRKAFFGATTMAEGGKTRRNGGSSWVKLYLDRQQLIIIPAAQQRVCVYCVCVCCFGGQEGKASCWNVLLGLSITLSDLDLVLLLV
jgi:hypothetical protein